MFRTELTIAPQERQLSRSARVLTVGSCFADSLGERLRLNKVNVVANPFGTVYQPLALAKLLRAAAGEEQDWQQHVVEARGRWQSYDFHATLGADSPVELLQAIQQQVQRTNDFLRQTDLVVLTLGTAWAYRLRETDELISNLHKLPAQLFAKELLTADEIVNSLAEVHALLRRLKPDIRIVLTVSPVRHLKDTLPLNAVSKSVLRVACHYLSELLPGVSYFPAYELLTDDLRDYRFYASDLLHPSEVAEDYIWDRFARAYFDADFGRFRKEWAAVRQSLTHRPLHLGAPEHRTFLDQTAERLERLVSQGVEVRQELRDVQRQLAALPPPRPTRQPDPLPEDDGEERIDIGGDDSTVITATAATISPSPEAATERQREGRGRNRRSRGRDRDRRSEQPATPEEPAVIGYTEEAIAEPLEEVLIGDELLDIPTEELASAASDEPAEGEDAGAYPAKKKKRRSRGGAKRTARKQAARLAAEQLLEVTEALPIDEETGTVDAGPAEELSLLAEIVADNLLAVETPDELLTGATEALAEAEQEQAPLVSEPLHELAADDLPAAEPTPETVAPVRKRGTGPTPKKSKVITKSSQVKRPKRTSLFRGASASTGRVVLAEAPLVPEVEVPATAPIVSTPILPEALLERPAVAEMIENPAVLAAPTDGQLLPEAPTPTKPRRGRPKAASAAATAAPADALTASKAAAAPTKTKRTAKPKAAADTPPRRGRPPGKKTPPAAEDSAT